MTGRVLHAPANSPSEGKIDSVAPAGSSDAICASNDSSWTLKPVSMSSARVPSISR